MYEAMVKEAYENIVGIDKEAGVRYEKIRKRLADARALRQQEKADRAGLVMDQKNFRTNEQKDLKNKITSDNLKNYAQYVGNVSARNTDVADNYRETIENRNRDAERKTALKNQKRSNKADRFNNLANLYNAMNDRQIADQERNTELVKALRDQRAENTVARRAIGHTHTTDAVGAADLRAAQRAHRLELAEQRKAEKAAATYEEAQLVKEAAEQDYMEACAYEDAALAILGELGYLD